MKINASLSISFPSGSGGHVNIRIRDNASRTEFIDLCISHEEFSRSLSSLTDRPVISCDVRGAENLGKERESESFILWHDADIPNKWHAGAAAAAALVEAATAQGYANDGWMISAHSALHTQQGYGTKDGHTWYRMSRTRYVEATEKLA